MWVEQLKTAAVTHQKLDRKVAPVHRLWAPKVQRVLECGWVWEDHPLGPQHTPHLWLSHCPVSLHPLTHTHHPTLWMIVFNDSEGSLWVLRRCPLLSSPTTSESSPRASGLAGFVHHHLLLIAHCHSNINSAILTLHPLGRNMCGKTARRAQEQIEWGAV